MTSDKDDNENEILFFESELDSQANTCGVNDVARILEYSGQVVKVSGFANNMEVLQDIPIVKAALAFDDPETNETLIIILNQALYFAEKVSHVLLNPDS